MLYRRRYKQITYPASVEEWTEAGYINPQVWNEDFGTGGFWVKVLANPTGHDERLELKLRSEFLTAPTEETRKAYREELANRVTEWNYQTENSDDEVVDVPAPADSDEGYLAFDLLPSNVASWLTHEIQTAHIPKAITPTSGQPGNQDNQSDVGPTQDP
jgi:hypothetical protein